MQLTFLQSSNVNKERFARKSEAVLPYRKINKNQSKQNSADKLNLFHPGHVQLRNYLCCFYVYFEMQIQNTLLNEAEIKKGLPEEFFK